MTRRRTAWRWARAAVAGATLAILVWRLGTGPFIDGLHAVDGGALAAASGLAVLTKVSRLLDSSFSQEAGS